MKTQKVLGLAFFSLALLLPAASAYAADSAKSGRAARRAAKEKRKIHGSGGRSYADAAGSGKRPLTEAAEDIQKRAQQTGSSTVDDVFNAVEADGLGATAASTTMSTLLESFESAVATGAEGEMELSREQVAEIANASRGETVSDDIRAVKYALIRTVEKHAPTVWGHRRIKNVVTSTGWVRNTTKDMTRGEFIDRMAAAVPVPSDENPLQDARKVNKMVDGHVVTMSNSDLLAYARERIVNKFDERAVANLAPLSAVMSRDGDVPEEALRAIHGASREEIEKHLKMFGESVALHAQYLAALHRLRTEAATKSRDHLGQTARADGGYGSDDEDYELHNIVIRAVKAVGVSDADGFTAVLAQDDALTTS